MIDVRNKKGITLVALVITIIVLLILAGVTIAMVIGDNGILTRASDAKEQTEYVSGMEELRMVINAAYTENLGSLTLPQAAVAIKKEYSGDKFYTDKDNKETNEISEDSLKNISGTEFYVLHKGNIYKVEQENNSIICSGINGSSNNNNNNNNNNNAGENQAAENFEKEMSKLFGNDYDIVDITPSEISAEYICNNWIKQFSTNESFLNYSEETGGKLGVYRANNYYALYSNTPIDFTNIDSIKIDVVNWTNNYCASAFYLGVQSTRELDENFYKSTNTEFSTATSYDVNNKETLTLDTSDLTGTYFIKIMCKHNDAQAYNAYSAFNSIRLYGDFNSDTVYKVRTIDFSTDENCALFEGYHSGISNNELNISKTNNGEFFISCSYANTYAIVRLKEKLDFSRIDYIMVDMHGSNDGGGAYPTNIIGLESEKQNTTSFDTNYTTTKSGSNFSYWKSFLNLTNVTGEYYFKFTLRA